MARVVSAIRVRGAKGRARSREGRPAVHAPEASASAVDAAQCGAGALVARVVVRVELQGDCVQRSHAAQPAASNQRHLAGRLRVGVHQRHHHALARHAAAAAERDVERQHEAAARAGAQRVSVENGAELDDTPALHQPRRSQLQPVVARADNAARRHRRAEAQRVRQQRQQRGACVARVCGTRGKDGGSHRQLRSGALAAGRRLERRRRRRQRRQRRRSGAQHARLKNRAREGARRARARRGTARAAPGEGHLDVRRAARRRVKHVARGERRIHVRRDPRKGTADARAAAARRHHVEGPRAVVGQLHGVGEVQVRPELHGRHRPQRAQRNQQPALAALAAAPRPGVGPEAAQVAVQRLVGRRVVARPRAGAGGERKGA